MAGMSVLVVMAVAAVVACGLLGGLKDNERRRGGKLIHPVTITVAVAFPISIPVSIPVSIGAVNTLAGGQDCREDDLSLQAQSGQQPAFGQFYQPQSGAEDDA